MGSRRGQDELNHDDILEDDSVKEIEKEFDYFYNMEMMKRLSANDTKVYDDTEFMMIPNCLMCMKKVTTMMYMMLKQTTNKTQMSLISF